ncbi:XdhC family protein [Streptomyces sp. NPDC001642]|uniref:XdhC family protein n=1 Tax=Streptomyces sp. NPDC001642 TaxID=3154392 RepID=UPI00332DC566
MVVVGAVEFAEALIQAARFLGHHVLLCDGCPVLGAPERFPCAHHVATDWPRPFLATTPTDGRTAGGVLTRYTRFDIPLLRAALRRPLGYVGAMRSRRPPPPRPPTGRRVRPGRTGPAERADRPRRRGRAPQEAAVSVVALMLARIDGRSGVPLAGSVGLVHPRVGEIAHPSQW